MWISNVGLADTVSLSPERLSMNDCSDVELRATKRAHSYLYLRLLSLLLSMKLFGKGLKSHLSITLDDFKGFKINVPIFIMSFAKDTIKKANVLVDDIFGIIGP